MPTPAPLAHTIGLIAETERQIQRLALRVNNASSISEEDAALGKAEHARLSAYLLHLKQIVRDAGH
jgi:hypothetical protein